MSEGCFAYGRKLLSREDRQMRRILARWLIRQMWVLVVRQPDDKYGTLGQRFNTLNLITTALGGHGGWFPQDVGISFLDLLHCMDTYHALRSELKDINVRRDTIMEKIKKIQSQCSHPRLPKRELGEEHMDECPDCGFVQYCYYVG